MRKLLRLLFRLALFAVVIIIGIMAVNTVRFSSRQLPIHALAPMPIADDVADRLAAALQIPTVSYEGRVDTAAFRQLDTFLQQKYQLIDSFLEHTAISEFSHVYKWPGKNPNLKPIILMGHLDVVPVEGKSEHQWTEQPFSGKVQDGYIWGRGALDDKSSVFGILEAVELLLQKNYAPERTVYLAFGHDEEVSGINGAIRIAAWLQQQGVQAEYVLDEGLVVLEQALPGLEQPLAMIGVAEKGYTTLRLTAKLPEGGHSSMPPQGTAIGILSQALVTLENEPFPAKIDGATAGLLRYAGPETWLPYKVLFANLWLTGGVLMGQLGKEPAANAIIRTTTAPTMLQGGVRENVLPTEATAVINFRILPGETVESVRAYVQETIDNERITVEIMQEEFSSNPSPISATNTFGFEVLQRSMQEVFPDVVVAPALVVGATDSRHYSQLTNNIYRFMPVQLTKADLKRIHGIDERISVEQYKQMIRFYRQLILNSCK